MHPCIHPSIHLVKNTIVLISTISIVYMATMHSTICALDQGLEPKTIARGKNNTADRAQDKDNWTRGQTWDNVDTIHHNQSAGETLHGSGARILATTIQVSSNTTTLNKHTHNSNRRRQALTPQEVACDNYGNNGSSSTGRRSITSSARRQSGQHEQIQTQAPLLQWRLQHVWRMEVQVHSIHGPTRQWLHTTTTSSRGCQWRADRSTTTRSSNNNWGWWTTCSPQHRLEVHPHQHNNWGSSNSLLTIPAHNWLWNVQTTLHTILNTTWHKINWTPYTTTQTKIRQQQFRGVILNMGIWAPTLWAWQWTTIARCSKNSSATQWDNRTTTTTPTTTLRTKPKLRQSQSNNHWILQIDNSIQQATTTRHTIIQRVNQLCWRTSTHGHWRSAQRKRKTQRKR